MLFNLRASSAGVLPLRSRIAGSEPDEISNYTASMLFSDAAICKAVRPSESWMFRYYPLMARAEMTF